jgi:hypothetical protein
MLYVTTRTLWKKGAAHLGGRALPAVYASAVFSQQEATLLKLREDKRGAKND